jgi:hypothetical protein
VAGDPEDTERTRVAAAESVCGAVMLIGGVLLIGLGGIAGAIGLALLFLGVGGLGHAVFYGLGLVDLPGTEERPPESRKDDDAR